MSDRSGKEAVSYPLRSPWVQWFCPAPKRYLQQLIVRHRLRNGLDIGCGEGSPLTGVRGAGFRSTGTDISPQCIEASRRRDVHDEYICADFMARDFEQQFDVVVLSHTIEHFPRDEASAVIRKVEALARRLVYIETPFGFLEQPAAEGNPFQRHLSGWFPHDFQGRGYAVFGSGPRLLRGPQGRPRLLPEPVVRAVSRALQWYYFRRPQRAATIVAMRYVDGQGNVRLL